LQLFVAGILVNGVSLTVAWPKAAGAHMIMAKPAKVTASLIFLR